METPSAAAVLAAAREICAGWGLTTAEAEQLVAGDAARAAAVIRIAELLATLYSDPLPAMWMTIPSRRFGAVRPVDHALKGEAGLREIWRLLEGYAQGE